MIGTGIAVFINPQKLYSGGITGTSQLIVNGDRGVHGRAISNSIWG
ncbi:MAG: hypothetical protein MZU97_22660 [Bacillus subtilis]|nr:hypothetical protein [Bacillus subtilis]